MERTLKAWVKKYFSTWDNLWYFFAQDKFTSGIPDVIGCYKGIFFSIELKDKGKKASKIQEWTMGNVEAAGGISRVADSQDQVISIMNEVMYEAEQYSK